MRRWTARHVATAGLAGTAAVAVAMAWARRKGHTRLFFPRILATLAGPGNRLHRGAGWIGFVGAGALLPLGYRTAVRLLGRPASVGLGTALGLAHGGVAAASAALLSPLHPRPRRARLASPGRPRPAPRELAVIVAVHALYGAVLGASARGHA